MNLKPTFFLTAFLVLPCLLVAAGAQDSNSGQPVEAPVPYASVSQLNGMLTQLEQVSQAAQGDLGKLRIEKWKTDGGTKRQTQSNVESIQRNLQTALPAMVSELRNSPESLPSTFKIYRTLDALYNVFGSVVESAGAFGSKDEFQTLENDLGTVEKSRRTFADRMESLANAKETELARLRTQLKAAQAAAPPPPAKKVIVDDTEPPKKPAKKKPVPKPPNAASSPAKPAPAAPQPQ
jgi:hypothetical protein